VNKQAYRWLALKHGRLLLISLFLLGMCLPDVIVAADIAQNDVRLQLNTAQQQWLKAHPVIRVGIDPDFAPYEYVNYHKQYRGVSSDFIKELSSLLNITFKVIPDLSWQQVVDGVRNKRIDMLAAVTPTPERKKFLKFTQPYIKYQVVIVSQTGHDFNELSNLKGKRVALVRGYAATELILKKQPDIIPVYVDTVLDGLKAVAEGSAIVVVGDAGTASYKMREFGLTSLKITKFLDLKVDGLAMAVRDDWSELAGILNLALASISEQRHHEIINHWLTTTESSTPTVSLTPHEKAFIQAHPDIRLGIDPEFIPFEFMDANGIYSGMASDYIKLLNQRLGLNMRVAYSENWKEAVQRAKKRQLDVLPSVGITDERKHYFLFSKAYIYFHRVVITRIDAPFISGLDDIANQRVAVQSNSSHEGYLRDHSQIIPQRYATLQTSLEAVSSGKADAFVGNLASTIYWIRKLNMTNLKIAASIESPIGKEGLHFAVRNDWPELVSIINKGLATISQAEIERISRKWVDVKVDKVMDYSMAWKVGLLLLALVLLVLLWNVKIRKQTLLAQQARAEAEAARAELEEAHMKKQAIFDSASAGIVMLTGRIITSCNHRMDEMYGCKPGEQVGKTTRIWYPDDATYEQIGRELQEKIALGGTHVGETLAVRKDGSRFWARASVRAIDPNNLEKGLVAVVEDISEERQMMEEILKAKETAEATNRQLQELDKLKSMFIASMSHELRTPLNSIIGFSGLLLQGVSGEISDEQREDIGRIYHSGKHLLDLITDVIDISKIEAGRVESYPVDIDLSALIEEAVKTVQPQLQEKELKLVVKLEPNIHLYADRKRLLQCLLNLMSNAVKYSEQGTITVTSSCKNHHVSVSVADTGIGIPDEQLPKLFEAFERLESHLRVKAGGTGLGLYLTKKITTDILHGSIRVESKVDEGSIFTITLPLEEK